MWKYVKCYLKTENSCLKTQTKHPFSRWYNDMHSFLNMCYHFNGFNALNALNLIGFLDNVFS